MSAFNDFPVDSPEALELINRALRLEYAADRAFRRWFSGDVGSSSGAASLAAKADEAWADVRLDVQDGPTLESGGRS